MMASNLLVIYHNFFPYISQYAGDKVLKLRYVIIEMNVFDNFLIRPKSHLVFRWEKGTDIIWKPSVKTLRSSLSAEFCKHCVLKC